MIEKWNGLVIRSTDVGDYDRILTVLTGEKGKITVFCRGVKRIKAHTAYGTDLFTYGEFILYRNGDKYRLSECNPIESFYHLRGDIEKLALASYLCDVTGEIAIENSDETPMQQLLLNALWCLEKTDKPPSLVKAAFEFRSAAIAGFAPNLSRCEICGTKDDGKATLDVMDGALLCQSCVNRLRDAITAGAVDQHEARILLPLEPDVLAALHYILSSPAKRQFSFSLDPSLIPALSRICETYLISHLGHGFRTLSFYKSLL